MIKPLPQLVSVFLGINIINDDSFIQFPGRVQFAQNFRPLGLVDASKEH